MASIRARKETKTLYIDFRYRGVRCREQTALKDTLANRRRLVRIAKKMEQEIGAGTFSYRRYFPNSKRADMFEAPVTNSPRPTEDELAGAAVSATQSGDDPSRTCVHVTESPLFVTFSEQWYSEREIDWKRSNQLKVRDILNKHLVPRFMCHASCYTPVDAASRNKGARHRCHCSAVSQFSSKFTIQP